MNWMFTSFCWANILTQWKVFIVSLDKNFCWWKFELKLMLFKFEHSRRIGNTKSGRKEDVGDELITVNRISWLMNVRKVSIQFEVRCDDDEPIWFWTEVDSFLDFLIKFIAKYLHWWRINVNGRTFSDYFWQTIEMENNWILSFCHFHKFHLEKGFTWDDNDKTHHQQQQQQNEWKKVFCWVTKSHYSMTMKMNEKLYF